MAISRRINKAAKERLRQLINKLSSSAGISVYAARKRLAAEMKALQSWGTTYYQDDGKIIVCAAHGLTFDVLPRHIRKGRRGVAEACVMSLAAKNSELKPVIRGALTGNRTLKLLGKLNKHVTIKFVISGEEAEQIRTYDEGGEWTLTHVNVYPVPVTRHPGHKSIPCGRENGPPKRARTRQVRYGTAN